MTVIVAARTSASKVVVAADRMTSFGGSRMENLEAKLWVSGRYVVGCAGDLRAAQVLRYGMNWPTYRPKEDVDWMRFVVTRVVPAMRATLEDHVLHLDRSYLGDVNVLLAIGGRFAAVYDNGAVMSDRTGRTAVGSGMSEALGYLGDGGSWAAGDVVTAARRAAITDKGVGGPISVADTKTLQVVTEDD